MVPGPGQHEQHDRGDVIGAHHPTEDVPRTPSALLEREIGCDSAGTDVGAATPALSQLVVERACEADLRELRRAVHGFKRKAAATGFGCERDDVGFAACEQMWQRRANRIESSLDVDVNHL